MTEHNIGNITITGIIETEGPFLPPGRIFPDLSADDLKANLGWMAPRFFDTAKELLIMTVQSFLIKTPHHTILVDGCVGNDKERPVPGMNRLKTPWLERLAAAGVRPDDIDVVMCTHLHPDHVGWNTQLSDGQWVPTFPNARYLVSEPEWQGHKVPEALDGGEAEPHIMDSVLPIARAGLADLVTIDHVIEDGIRFLPLPGHTPGQVGLHLEAGGNETVLCADMVHHPIQCAIPELSTGFCFDKQAAARTRRAFFEHYAGSSAVIAPAHFIAPTFGHIEGAGDRFRFKYLGE